MTTNDNIKILITDPDKDFSQWYQDVLREAELVEHGPVKGTMIIKPYGYKIWEKIQDYLNEEFSRKKIQNAYFPLLIPEEFLKREEEHLEGFSPEIVAATYAGGKRLKNAYVLRPTSETIIYDAFSRWIHSFKDLPLLVNQWANVIRWEMRPRLFLRTTEFLWQEGHTAHANAEEADNFARGMMQTYHKFVEELLAVPVVMGEKTESERFAGAEKTYTLEAMTREGKALQFGTSHNLGQNFSKVFSIDFTTETGETGLVWQTSWGVSTRTIGGTIMVHGDKKGLVLPPAIAPLEIVIVPIWMKSSQKGDVLKFAERIEKVLSRKHSTKFDANPDKRAGDKFYNWERRGVPLRIEVGPREVDKEVAKVVCRDLGDKHVLKCSELESGVDKLLSMIQSRLLLKARQRLEEKTVLVDSWPAFKEKIDAGFFILAHWSGRKEEESEIKKKTSATIRCIPFDSDRENGKCIISGRPSERRVLFAKAY